MYKWYCCIFLLKYFYYVSLYCVDLLYLKAMVKVVPDTQKKSKVAFRFGTEGVCTSQIRTSN
jgi:hypothetical protein